MPRIAPILGGCDTTVGELRGEPVWLVWHNSHDGSSRSVSLQIAMSVGYPMMGTISSVSDRRERDMPSFPHSAFFEHFTIGVKPAEVGPRVVVDAQTCFHVRRVFRGGGGGYVRLRNGFITTSAEFYKPSPIGIGTGVHRPPTLEETTALVEDVAHLAARFRDAYQRSYAEIAQTGGREAAEAWSRAAADAQVAEDRRTKKVMLIVFGVVGCVSLAIIVPSLAFTAAMMWLTG
ncbi:hypothetical protein JYT86_00180 [bacterium AH-315-N03]|nr:hypothetical protein [bacterium AH-315-N03]